MPPRKHRKGRPSRRLLIWIGGIVAALILIPALVLATLVLTIDPNSYKQRIQTAVEAATGRQFEIRGPISVSPSLTPTITAQDVVLANMPGGTRKDMARVDEMQIALAPRALLTGRIIVARMVLLHPDLLLETDAKGQGNWVFTPPARPAPANAAPHDAPANPGAARQDAGLQLQTLHIRDGRLTFHDGVTGATTVFDIPRISATAATADSPVTFGADIVVNRRHLNVTAQTGPLSRLQDSTATAPWALFMNIDDSGAKLTVAGSIARPQEFRGYSLRLDGAIPDLSALSWLSPVPLPPVHNVSFSARLLNQGGAVPDISAVTVQAGLTNLEAISPGFTLDSARLDMPSLTEPAALTADGSYSGMPLHVSAAIGAPALLLPAIYLPPSAKLTGPFDIGASADIAGGSFGVRGSIAAPATKSGMDIFLGARVPDLAALSPLAGQALPALKTLAFSAHLVDGPGGYDHAIGLHSVALTLPQADLSGDAMLSLGARLGVQATLSSARIDADALLAAFAAAAKRNGKAPTAPAATVNATLPPPLPPRGNTIIPDAPLPFDMLDRADLDVTARIGELKLDGVTARDLSGHIVTKDGRLAAGPITATLPSGHASVTLAADSRQPAPPIAVYIAASGLDAKSLLTALGVADPPGGTLEIHTDLRAAGRTPHALAGTLEGQAALGLVDSDIDNATLAAAFGEILRAGRLPDLGPETGRTRLRCLALRFTAAGGVATLGTAVLDTDRLLLNASGTVALGPETLALRLRPMVRTSGPGIVVPLRLDGSFSEPKVQVDSSGIAGANMKSALGIANALLGGKPVVQTLESERGGDACGPALAAVRATP
jgi:AsmA protein